MSLEIEISQYDGLELVCSVRIPSHRLSDRQAETLMRALAARHLTFEEVVESSLSRHRGKPARQPLLDVLRDKDAYQMSSGENPHYALRVVDRDLEAKDAH